jgi:hypothetical protein
MGAPIALDWGMDAPVRYLTAGSVTPIEIFGYASLSAPDAGFNERLRPFWTTRTTSVCCTALPPQSSRGGPTTFLQWPEPRADPWCRLRRFAQRDGTPLCRSGKYLRDSPLWGGASGHSTKRFGSRPACRNVEKVKQDRMLVS